MPGLRFSLDIHIPQSATGTVVAGVRIPTALATQIPDIRARIQALKTFAKKINEGLPNEEATVKAAFHVCHHEDGGPCEAEQEI